MITDYVQSVTIRERKREIEKARKCESGKARKSERENIIKIEIDRQRDRGRK
jgi:hypothetical protein